MHTDPTRAVKFALVAALLLALAVPPTVRADDPPAGLAKATKLIDDQKAVIGRFMHPTSSLDRIACTKTKVYETGEFYVVYAFYFDGGKYNSSLRFKFFEDGSLDGLAVAGTTTWIKPFQAADLVLKGLVKMVPQVGARVTALLKDGAAATALEFWLRSR